MACMYHLRRPVAIDVPSSGSDLFHRCAVILLIEPLSNQLTCRLLWMQAEPVPEAHNLAPNRLGSATVVVKRPRKTLEKNFHRVQLFSCWANHETIWAKQHECPSLLGKSKPTASFLQRTMRRRANQSEQLRPVVQESIALVLGTRRAGPACPGCHLLR